MKVDISFLKQNAPNFDVSLVGPDGAKDIGSFDNLLTQAKSGELKNQTNIVKIGSHKYKVEAKTDYAKSEDQYEKDVSKSDETKQKEPVANNDKKTLSSQERLLVLTGHELSFVLKPLNYDLFVKDTSKSIQSLLLDVIDKVVKVPETSRYLFSFNKDIPLEISIERLADDGWEIILTANSEIRSELAKNMEEIFQILRKHLQSDNIEVRIEELQTQGKDSGASGNEDDAEKEQEQDQGIQSD
jgi:hypothetical protein